MAPMNDCGHITPKYCILIPRSDAIHQMAVKAGILVLCQKIEQQMIEDLFFL